MAVSSSERRKNSLISSIKKKWQDRFFTRSRTWLSILTISISAIIAIGGQLPLASALFILIPAIFTLSSFFLFPQKYQSQFMLALILSGMTMLLSFPIHRGISLGILASIVMILSVNWAFKETNEAEEIARIKTPEEQLKDRLQEIRESMELYTRKIRYHEEQLLTSNKYLVKVKQQLDDKKLKPANLKTSQNLRTSLEKSINNRKLMIKFFTEVKARYEREMVNLQNKIDNIEIIDFLEGQHELEEAVELERAMLDAQFQDELDKIEAELPTLITGLEENSADLSEDMKRRLEDTIGRLQEY